MSRDNSVWKIVPYIDNSISKILLQTVEWKVQLKE